MSDHYGEMRLVDYVRSMTELRKQQDRTAALLAAACALLKATAFIGICDGEDEDSIPNDSPEYQALAAAVAAFDSRAAHQEGDSEDV